MKKTLKIAMRPLKTAGHGGQHIPPPHKTMRINRIRLQNNEKYGLCVKVIKL